MAVKFLLTILMACLRYIYSDELQPNCTIHDETLDPYRYHETCTDGIGNTFEIIDYYNRTLRIEHTGEHVATINLKMFSKSKVNDKFDLIHIENCTMEHNVSFGVLFEHLGISTIGNFFGGNIGSSLNGLFSTGFESAKSLKLFWNVNQLTEDYFEALKKIYSLKMKTYSAVEFTRELSGITDEADNGIHVLGKASKNILEISQKYLSNLGDDGNSFQNIFDAMESGDLEGLVKKMAYKDSTTKPLQFIVLSMGKNELESLTSVAFQDLRTLEVLDLSFNKLNNLPEDLFDNLNELKILNLSDNLLENISQRIFQYQENVMEINLNNNNLTSIHPNAFINSKALLFLFLVNNKLSSSDEKLTFLNHLNRIRFLHLMGNNLTKLSSYLLNISDNALTEVNLSYNQIPLSEFSNLWLGHNPNYLKLIKCEYGMYDILLRTEHPKKASSIKSSCVDKSMDIPLDIPMNDLMNELMNELMIVRTEAHPPSDRCYTEIKVEPGFSDRYLLLFCANSGLQRMPQIESGLDFISFKLNDSHIMSTELSWQDCVSVGLDVSHNNLTELSKIGSNLLPTFIQASHNKIFRIALADLPANLIFLDVSHNYIRSISSDVLQRLSSLELIFLQGNTFECECHDENTERLIELIEKYSRITSDLIGTMCNADYELSRNAHNRICSARTLTFVLSIIVVLLFLVVVLVYLFYKYKQFIKVWLFTHNSCLWWVDEEFLDNDLEFDAFISYSEKDKRYAHFLVEKLENYTSNYKLFVHERNFVPGRAIEDEVQRAIASSCRTIVILSKDYIKSAWTVHEFHCAYRRSIAEKRNRLIVVRYGDFGLDDETDEIIKSYIQTYSYIDSNDKWFFDKIRYALPHKHKRTESEILESTAV